MGGRAKECCKSASVPKSEGRIPEGRNPKAEIRRPKSGPTGIDLSFGLRVSAFAAIVATALAKACQGPFSRSARDKSGWAAPNH
jgi:hypothetical protein